MGYLIYLVDVLQLKMVEIYNPAIKLPDLEAKLTEYLVTQGFHRLYLNEISGVDRDCLYRRDSRQSAGSGPLGFMDRWRSADDYLLYDNLQGTLAYVRQSPHQSVKNVSRFEVHLRTAAEDGFLPRQYYPLAIPQKNLSLICEMLVAKYPFSSIGDMETFGRLSRIPAELDLADDVNLPVHLFHSVQLGTHLIESRHSEIENAIEGLSLGIGSVIIASHLFSRKQIQYYQAAAEVDRQISESPIMRSGIEKLFSNSAI